MGDVVVPTGATYQLPIPLLFAHKHDEPIGSVVKATVTAAGIRIRAKLTAGVARADEVWKLIRDGALTAVSIGFRSLKHTPLPTGGLRFDSWEWDELSVVSVPAQPDAKIAIAKCLVRGGESIRIPEAPKIDRAWQKRGDVMDGRKLPPMDDPGWMDAVIENLERSTKPKIEQESARHGKSAVIASAIVTGEMFAISLKAIHELAKSLAEVQKASAANADALNQSVEAFAHNLLSAGGDQ